MSRFRFGQWAIRQQGRRVCDEILKPACEHNFVEMPGHGASSRCIKCGIAYEDAGTEKERR
jgi:hypothetical protein